MAHPAESRILGNSLFATGVNCQISRSKVDVCRKLKYSVEQHIIDPLARCSDV
jgi:hypothetical protein